MARPRMPRLPIMGFGLLSFTVVAWIGWQAANWLPLPDGALYRWLVRVVIWTVGLVITAIVFRLLHRRSAAKTPAAPDPVDQHLDQAEKRLKAAGRKGRRPLGRLPAVVVLGPRGTAKTTLVQRSDLGTELLAGNVFSAGVAPPTEAVNVWYHEDHVLLEAGGPVVDEADRWQRLVDRIQPRKWIPALLGRPQAPRVAVVCYSVEALERAGDDVVAAARSLRSRLTEMSEAIGIRLPVYVVFTKADTIDHFEAFVEHLSEPEVHELLGTTLRAQPEASGTSWKDREAARIRVAFDELFLSLAERRIDVLARSGSTEGNGAAYEFPREFRKVAGRATEFLLELVRPHQLQVSPFLRGFYFTGVRPVVVSEAAEVPTPEPSRVPSAPEGATQVFDLRKAMAAEAAPAARTGGRTRRVPQWVFLDRILGRVVLADRVAMGITTGGAGLNVLRRMSLAAGLAVVLLVGGMALIGFGAERDLQQEALAAVQGVDGLRSRDPALASLDDLQRLEALRSVTWRLSHYENEDRPARALLGMYTGGSLYPAARFAWFQRFEPVLLARARDGVMTTLHNLPEEPSLDDYHHVYNALKLHVETTDHPEQADSTFFGRELTGYWMGGSAPGEEQRELARAQFAFYGAELRWGNPSDAAADNQLVASGREFLAEHTNFESFYGSLLAQWDGLPGVSFNDDHPGTGTFVRNRYPVRGAFTREGWDSIHHSFSSAGDAFNLDRHVVGDRFHAALAEQGFDPEELTPQLRERYQQDYIRTWAEFLAGTEVLSPGIAAAGGWLESLGGRESALFRLLNVVDRNTRVDAPAVETAFQPVRMLVAPDTVSQLFSEEWGGPYLSSVRGLGQAASQWAGNTGDQDATQGFVQAASDGRGFVQGLAAGFPIDPPEASAVGNSVTRVLNAPFEWAVGVAARGGALAANQVARAFCTDQGRVFGRYPFQLDAADADPGDLHALLQPDQGDLYAFIEEAEATGSDLNARYESFIRQADEIARSFYGRNATSPSFPIQFRIVSFNGIASVVVNVDGRRREFTPTRQEVEVFEWDGQRAEEVTLGVDTGEGMISREYDGRWALFKFFHQADWQDLGGGRHRVTWPLEGGLQVVGEVAFSRAPLLNPGYLSGLSCPTIIAR